MNSFNGRNVDDNLPRNDGPRHLWGNSMTQLALNAAVYLANLSREYGSIAPGLTLIRSVIGSAIP